MESKNLLDQIIHITFHLNDGRKITISPTEVAGDLEWDQTEEGGRKDLFSGVLVDNLFLMLQEYNKI